MRIDCCGLGHPGPPNPLLSVKRRQTQTKPPRIVGRFGTIPLVYDRAILHIIACGWNNNKIISIMRIDKVTTALLTTIMITISEYSVYCCLANCFAFSQAPPKQFIQKVFSVQMEALDKGQVLWRNPPLKLASLETLPHIIRTCVYRVVVKRQRFVGPVIGVYSPSV